MLSCMYDVSKKKGYELLPPDCQILRVFQYNELKKATNNFSSKRRLTCGGGVYKGFMNKSVLASAPSSSSSTSKVLVVIKSYKYDFIGQDGGETSEHKKWLDEVDFLGRLSHPNFVRLLGYCSTDEQLYLVSEYMAKGSLNNHLLNGTLSWDQRMSIALGVAQGLAILNSCSDIPWVYDYFKPSRILLDQDYTVKILVFGLPTIPRVEESRRLAIVRSKDPAYFCPDFFETGQRKNHSIVYSFGVLLYMMLIGVHRVRDTTQKYWMIKEFSVSNKAQLEKMIDPCLKGQYTLELAFNVAQYTSKCLSARSFKRANCPSMQEVASEFAQLLNETGN